MIKPRLIIVGGFAGGGKTTLAHKLAEHYAIPIFGSDAINDVMTSQLDLDFHSASPASHELTWYLAREQLLNGVSVIVDTPMCNPTSWLQLDRLREKFPDVEIMPIILHADLATHKSRIQNRGLTNHGHLNLGGDTFEDIAFKHAFIENLQRPDMIKIDASGTPDQVYEKVVTLLSEPVS